MLVYESLPITEWRSYVLGFLEPELQKEINTCSFSFLRHLCVPKWLFKIWHLWVINVLSLYPAWASERVCVSARHQLAQEFGSVQSRWLEFHSTYHRTSRTGPGTLWRCFPRWTWTESTASLTWRWRRWAARRSGKSHRSSQSWTKLWREVGGWNSSSSLSRQTLLFSKVHTIKQVVLQSFSGPAEPS